MWGSKSVILTRGVIAARGGATSSAFAEIVRRGPGVAVKARVETEAIGYTRRKVESLAGASVSAA